MQEWNDNCIFIHPVCAGERHFPGAPVIHGNRKEEYIKLGQALKAAGLVESGVDAKYAIEDGLVSVNGETAFQRGKKLVDGDVVVYEGNTIKIIK